MTWARGRISHITRKAISSAICATRIIRRVRRSRRSQLPYCALGTGRAPAANAVSALGSSAFGTSPFNMDFKLLPKRVEVAVELRRVARGERCGAAAIGTREVDRMVGFHAARPPRQHDYPLRHADRLADVVRHQD